MITKENLQQLLTEDEQLARFREIVSQTIEEEKLLSDKLLELEDRNPSFSNKVADKVAVFGGSWKFIIAFVLFMALWILSNIYLLKQSFDPYPFILLNLILSTIAAMQAPVILMSQNRQEAKDRQRAVNDYLINLKAEIEVRRLHEKIDLLVADQMKTLFAIQKVQMEIMEEIRENVKPSTL
jgi:uncharacterized membrane protein